MNVIVLAVELHESRLEIPANGVEDRPHGLQDGLCKDVPTVFCDKDQMHMKCKDTMPPSTSIACKSHRPMLS